MPDAFFGASPGSQVGTGITTATSTTALPFELRVTYTNTDDGTGQKMRLLNALQAIVAHVQRTQFPHV